MKKLTYLRRVIKPSELDSNERRLRKVAMSFIRAEQHVRSLLWLHDEREMRDAANLGVYWLDGSAIVPATDKRDRVLKRLLMRRAACHHYAAVMRKLDPHGDLRESLVLLGYLPTNVPALWGDLPGLRGQMKEARIDHARMA